MSEFSVTIVLFDHGGATAVLFVHLASAWRSALPRHVTTGTRAYREFTNRTNNTQSATARRRHSEVADFCQAHCKQGTLRPTSARPRKASRQWTVCPSTAWNHLCCVRSLHGSLRARRVRIKKFPEAADSAASSSLHPHSGTPPVWGRAGAAWPEAVAKAAWPRGTPLSRWNGCCGGVSPHACARTESRQAVATRVDYKRHSIWGNLVLEATLPTLTALLLLLLALTLRQPRSPL